MKKGLDWLVEHLLAGGGWGEGEESPQMRQSVSEHESLRDVKGRMPDDGSNMAVVVALAKVVRKIVRHQTEDGSFDGQGWARILAQGMCGKGINRARQAGASVPEQLLARAENGAKFAFQYTSPATIGGIGHGIASEPLSVSRSSGRGTAGAMGTMTGAAGVEL